LVLKHLRDNPASGAPLAELCQVLPALSTRSVQRLMAELREEGKAILKGRHKGALWFPADMRQKEEVL
jgi:biotin operon repressor